MGYMVDFMSKQVSYKFVGRVVDEVNCFIFDTLGPGLIIGSFLYIAATNPNLKVPQLPNFENKPVEEITESKIDMTDFILPEKIEVSRPDLSIQQQLITSDFEHKLNNSIFATKIHKLSKQADGHLFPTDKSVRIWHP